jgi:hypothetical protein
MAKVVPAVEKLDGAYIENASPADKDTQQQEVVVREFDPKFMRKTMIKVRRPSMVATRLCAVVVLTFLSWT